MGEIRAARCEKNEGANVAGLGLRGALGLTVEQVWSTHGWQGARVDADVPAQTESLCGSKRQCSAVPSVSALRLLTFKNSWRANSAYIGT